MRMPVRNLLEFAGVALPFIVVALAFSGPRAGKLLVSGLAVFVLGAALSLYHWRKGAAADREYNDERQDYIFTRAARFCAYVTAVSLQGLWAYHFVQYGNTAYDPLFWMMGIFWGSFLGAYLYYHLRS
ncbi:MAG: hypothetical protein QMC81_08415 [Thermoanaerobacterales bacterium]|nr:hypothetical protein [Bacillota bacterium]MDI6907493.1 hypothetical protein [Thermoanaerobacterales bacterium]